MSIMQLACNTLLMILWEKYPNIDIGDPDEENGTFIDQINRRSYYYELNEWRTVKRGLILKRPFNSNWCWHRDELLIPYLIAVAMLNFSRFINLLSQNHSNYCKLNLISLTNLNMLYTITSIFFYHGERLIQIKDYNYHIARDSIAKKRYSQFKMVADIRQFNRTLPH